MGSKGKGKRRGLEGGYYYHHYAGVEGGGDGDAVSFTASDRLNLGT